MIVRIGYWNQQHMHDQMHCSMYSSLVMDHELSLACDKVAIFFTWQDLTETLISSRAHDRAGKSKYPSQGRSVGLLGWMCEKRWIYPLLLFLLKTNRPETWHKNGKDKTRKLGPIVKVIGPWSRHAGAEASRVLLPSLLRGKESLRQCSVFNSSRYWAMSKLTCRKRKKCFFSLEEI